MNSLSLQTLLKAFIIVLSAVFSLRAGAQLACVELFNRDAANGQAADHRLTLSVRAPEIPHSDQFQQYSVAQLRAKTFRYFLVNKDDYLKAHPHAQIRPDNLHPTNPQFLYFELREVKVGYYADLGFTALTILPRNVLDQYLSHPIGSSFEVLSELKIYQVKTRPKTELKLNFDQLELKESISENGFRAQYMYKNIEEAADLQVHFIDPAKTSAEVAWTGTHDSIRRNGLQSKLFTQFLDKFPSVEKFTAELVDSNANFILKGLIKYLEKNPQFKVVEIPRLERTAKVEFANCCLTIPTEDYQSKFLSLLERAPIAKMLKHHGIEITKAEIVPSENSMYPVQIKIEAEKP